jgi:hypothetical protein
MFRPALPCARASLWAGGLSALAALALSTSAAVASPGYQPDATKPSISLDADVPGGVAVDQVSQNVYVAELTSNLVSVAPGEVEQLSPTGAPTANSPFGTGGEDLFVAVAVNPATQGIYAYQTEGSTPVGHKGSSKVSGFSSSGVLGSSFSTTASSTETVGVDTSGRFYYPNSTAGSVQVFSPAGSLEDTIVCSGCPGGSFSEPVAAAFDSTGSLYVVDQANGRVIKLSPSAGSYSYQSTLQAGAGAVAVGIDPSSNDVFVGDLSGGTYHVVAYNASGTRFDDFGAGLVSPSLVQAANGQLAANETTHDVYLTDPGGDRLLVFERIASIPEPIASVAVPSPVGQVDATLRANVNPKGHVLSDCHFEYITDADFQANGYANAKSIPCPSLLGSPGSTPVSAKAGGLSPATGYDYRILVASNGGSDESVSQAFTTLPPLPPDAVATVANAITQTTATLAGTVNPHGGPISNCQFEFATEAAFLEKGFTGAGLKACSPTPSGTTAVGVTAKLTGLLAGGAYRFRVVATNNSGTAKGADKAFTMLADTCQTNPAVCPPPSGGASQPPAQAPGTPPVSTPPAAKRPLKCKKGFKKKRVHGKLKCVKVKPKRHHG